ncbi:MAG: hypothetical protein HC901_01160 [Bdellovibrionaceae bacterium]|nr:hypothetical protein [Pseudobdellovibrionaceae bacterium]
MSYYDDQRRQRDLTNFRARTRPAATRSDVLPTEVAASNSPRAATSAAVVLSAIQAEDLRRGDFLRAMDDSGETLYEFEASFVGSFLRDRHGKDASLDFQWFTPRRRYVVDQMIARYGRRTTKPVARVREIAAAEPGKCAYLVRDPERGLNQRCGQPATCKLGELELCDDCRRSREEGFARMKKNLRY